MEMTKKNIDEALRNGESEFGNVIKFPGKGPQLLNYKQVMALLACSASSLWALANKGALKRKYYPGIGYRWNKDDVLTYIKEAGI